MGNPIWSPDSSEFIWHLYDEEQARLIITDRETFDSRELLAVDRFDPFQRDDLNLDISPLSMLGWSPDGQWLLIYAELTNGVAGLHLINREGGTPYTVLETGINDFRSYNAFWLPAQ